MTQGEDSVSRLTGLEVFLPDGRRLGVVHDAVEQNGDYSWILKLRQKKHCIYSQYHRFSVILKRKPT